MVGSLLGSLFLKHGLHQQMIVVNGNLTFSTSLVSLPSGGPTEGGRGGAAAAGEEDFRGRENEAAGARREEEGCGCSGETSKPDYT